MIYCNLKGGLGNMMFQIAGTYSISREKEIECSFPNLHGHLSYLNSDGTYNPKLNHSQEYDIFLSKLNVTHPSESIPTIEYPFEYREIQLPNDNFFVSGFFQSEKYFVKYREDILKLFEVDDSIYNMLSEKYPFINNFKCTSIHIRRGDYVHFSSFHPPQSMDYYNNAIEILNPYTDKFIIFSDDIEWCKNNFIGDEFIFIENEKDYFEMILMTMCKNHIIANSSFSWWGAWLNNYPDKKVVGPKAWFGPSISHNTDDIIPVSWTKV